MLKQSTKNDEQRTEISVNKPKILMLLTSHRLDCFKLTMDFLFASGSLPDFDRVVLMLNGVVGKHRQYVDDLMSGHPEIQWDTVAGPRGKGAFVANLQNETVRRYPGSLYFKIDEDVFVSKNWHTKMLAAYERYCGDDRLALVTSLIPNNAMGFYHLLQMFPDLSNEYGTLFDAEKTSRCDGPVWNNPSMAEWIIRKFLDIEEANRRVEQCVADGADPFVKFAERFSINCLLYDYRHWQELGGIPDDEEPAWGQWVPDHGKFNVLVRNALQHHYTFFVQQEWMDRSSLLEDFRKVNLPETCRPLTGQAARAVRMAKQVPEVLKRRVCNRK